jgi:hypothetical protein
VLACFHPFFSRNTKTFTFIQYIVMYEIGRWNLRSKNSRSSAYRNEEDKTNAWRHCVRNLLKTLKINSLVRRMNLVS